MPRLFVCLFILALDSFSFQNRKGGGGHSQPKYSYMASVYLFAVQTPYVASVYLVSLVANNSYTTI